MILAALAYGVMVQSSHVLEMPDPTAEVVTIQAVVKLPELSWKQRNLLKVVAGTMGGDTTTYSRNQIADLAARVGQRLRVTVMEDHLRVSYQVLAPDFKNGIAMVASVLRESTPKEEELQSSIENLQFRQLGFWAEALDGMAFDTPRYTARELDDLKTLVFRPENTTVAISGKFEPGQATARWGELEFFWKPKPIPRPDRDNSPSKSLTKLDGSLSVIELRGPAFSAKDAAFPTRLLTLFALGTGKGASLFRIAREKLGWSYRQESVLWPTRDGFAPRLIVAQSQADEIDKRAETLRTELLEDVKGWTEDDRKRALGMAEMTLMRNAEVSPLYFLPNRPLTNYFEDAAFLNAYWQMKAGEPWNPAGLFGRMTFVSLEDLKASAQEMLASSIARVYRAGK